MPAKVLLVDDEKNILQAMRRNLMHRCNLHTAESAAEALELLRRHGPFAVVISDLRMPGMDGIRFLGLVREHHPITVRMLLTGFADLQVAIDAVNQGSIFRLLTKPCAPETMDAALKDGLAQYRMALAEKELLEKTLHGGIKVMADLLALTNPTAFGRATRLARMTRMLAANLELANQWEVEVAAMLSLIGCVTVPESVLQKAFQRLPLTVEDDALFKAHPRIGHDLIVNIPRMENVADIIARQQHPWFDGAPDAPPVGARILKVVADYDTLISGGLTGRQALEKMSGGAAGYDSRILNALGDVLIRLEAGPRYALQELTVRDLKPGMVFAEDLFSCHGVLLVARGQDVTTPIVMRLRNFVGNAAVREPFKMLISTESAPTASV